MNPNDEIQRGRLFRAMEQSYRALEPFRNLNRGLVEEYAGSGYGRQGKGKREILVNLMNQTVDAYTMALAANRPRVMASCNQPEYAYFCKHFQTAINGLIEEIGLEFTLRQWVLDAFFCVGIVKIHLADSGYVRLEGDRWADPGQPFASNVSLDNWVHDMGATRLDQVRWAADSYRIPFEDLKDPAFDQQAVAELQPTSKLAVDTERLDQISRGEEVDSDDVEPMIDLCDVWVPRDNKIYTFAMDRRTEFRAKGSPVAVMDWFGDERGPYHLLGFNDVPENIMPSSPASQVGALARLANNLIRKSARQAMRQKELLTYSPAAAPDAKRVASASDGDIVQVVDPKEIMPVKMGGANAENQAMFLGVTELFDRMAGNLTAMLGLGAQAGTASQEELIHGAVNKKEAQMAYRVVDGTVRIVRSLGKLLWDDRAKVIPGRIPIEGAAGYSVDATWTPQDREGRFEDYKLDIDVYSMAYQSPAQRVAAINQLVTQVYAPLMQLLMQQGGQINLQKLTDQYAELLNLPQLKEIVQFVNVLPSDEDQQPGMGGMGMEEAPGMPAATTREYIRRNVPTAGTVQSRSRVAQSEWLGRSSQNNPDQTASLRR